MLGTSPSCIGECLVFSPGIDGEMVTSAITAASAIAIGRPVRVRKEQGVAQLGQIRERKYDRAREKVKHYSVSFILSHSLDTLALALNRPSVDSSKSEFASPSLKDLVLVVRKRWSPQVHLSMSE